MSLGLSLDVFKLVFTDYIFIYFSCVPWSNDLTEYLFQNTGHNLLNTWVSFSNSRPSLWNLKSKPNARSSVWKALSRVCVVLCRNFIKKETLAQMFCCEFCEISENAFFTRSPPVAASVCYNTAQPPQVANNNYSQMNIVKFEYCSTILIRIGNTWDISHNFYQILWQIFHDLVSFFYQVFNSFLKIISWVIRQKTESQNRCFKKTKHAKFFEERTFLTPWYAHVLVFRKIWRVLFSWNTRCEIRPFALLPTI